VLITLAIIGVVAAMTIPTLVAKYEVKQTVTALRKFQTTMNQAYLRIVAEEGSANQWDVTTNESLYDVRHSVLFEKFRPYLRVSKDCIHGPGCFGEGTYKKIDGKDAKDWDGTYAWYKVSLADGMSVLFHSRGTLASQYGNTTEHGTILVDINGKKSPNTMGKDMFTFMITNNGIVPYGHPRYKLEYHLIDGNGNYMTDENGDYVMTTDVMLDCNRQNCVNYCESCAAWVVEHGNMDYLHCDDLSWDGKHKCSD